MSELCEILLVLYVFVNRMCRITPGELVCDPMCGGGSIPVEAGFVYYSFHVNVSLRFRDYTAVHVDTFKFDSRLYELLA